MGAEDSLEFSGKGRCFPDTNAVQAQLVFQKTNHIFNPLWLLALGDFAPDLLFVSEAFMQGFAFAINLASISKVSGIRASNDFHERYSRAVSHHVVYTDNKTVSCSQQVICPGGLCFVPFCYFELFKFRGYSPKFKKRTKECSLLQTSLQPNNCDREREKNAQKQSRVARPKVRLNFQIFMCRCCRTAAADNNPHQYKHNEHHAHAVTAGGKLEIAKELIDVVFHNAKREIGNDCTLTAHDHRLLFRGIRNFKIDLAVDDIQFVWL